MKKLLVIIFMFISYFGYSQDFTIPTPTEEAKEPFNIVIQYRLWESYLSQVGDGFSYKYHWVYKIKGFYNYEEMIKWLNRDDAWIYNDNQKIAILNESEFISAYDLSKMQKIDLKFNKEHKIKERQIIIEKDEWDNTYWSK